CPLSGSLLSPRGFAFTSLSFRFFCHATPPTEIYTLSLHDALPILAQGPLAARAGQCRVAEDVSRRAFAPRAPCAADRHGRRRAGDRKSTRLNSSHQIISYAVFCLKKKKTITRTKRRARTRTCRRQQ